MEKLKNFGRKMAKAISRSWSWYKKLYSGKKWYTKLALGLVSFLVFIFLWLFIVDINLFWLFGGSPGFINGGLDLKPSQASIIYSADGEVIGKYFNENRTPVEFEEVNPVFWDALIDTEDERFYTHWGIDPIGIFGAVKDAAIGRGGRGASTLTQQLAKNLYRTRTDYSSGLLGKIPGLRMLINKSKEWVIATKLEVKHSKREILNMYANTVDFGSNAFGIKTAAKTYFNTTPDKLKIEEAAVLVGMLKATTYYNPLKNPENSLKRRNQVLENMMSHGDISSLECDSLKEIPIQLNFSVESNYDGQAQYFRSAVAEELKEWCSTNHVDLYADGLKIYTTIDTRMQKYAEAAARKQMKPVQNNFRNHWGKEHPWQDEKHKEIPNFIEHIAEKLPEYQTLDVLYDGNRDSIYHYLNKPHTVKLFDYDKGTIEAQMSTLDSIRYMVSFMHCGFVAIEPQTGHVKAWVGDVDFNHWKYDKVTAMRQPGSTFKLFVYTEAMQQGLTPCDKRRDERFSMQVYDVNQKKEVMWSPSNANGYFTGDSVPLKAAFARSINSIAVRLGQEMGIRHIASTAHEMGIESHLDETPSLPLGSSDVNLLELAGAYCTVADYGKAKRPVLVTRIEDREGNIIYDDPSDSHQVLSAKTSFFMQQLLMGGMTEPGGTSQSLWGYVGDVRDTDFGGKTGTSNNHSDAWFMCVSPNLVCGAWVGGEYRCIHFRTGALGQGSRTALPICGYFLQSVMKDSRFQKYHGKFVRPDDPDIQRGMYECSRYYESRRDTFDIDSISTDESAEFFIDAAGNPHPVHHHSAEPTPVEPREEPVLFEDM